MAVLNTATEQRVLTEDEPYTIERLNNRYYFTAELVTEHDKVSVRIWVYDAVANTELVSPRVVSETEASSIWQSWYGVLSA